MAADWTVGFVTGWHPRHLKTTTPLGEDLAYAQYNTVEDFLAPNMGTT